MFFLEAHDWLEEIVVEPELVIQLVEAERVGHGIQTGITYIGAYLAKVVFFHKAIVVFGIGTAAAEIEGRGPFAPAVH